MPSTVVESVIFGGVFSEKEMSDIFSDDNFLRNLLLVEAALAKAQAELGMIPKDAALEIDKKSRTLEVCHEELREKVDAAGHVLVPLLRELTDSCEESAGAYVHWGATTQDIVDTANIMRISKAFDLVMNYLKEIMGETALLAEKEAETVIVGRTHGQHAVPTTFGYKAAVWYWELERNLQRWQQAAPRVLVGNLTGAVGNFASFEGQGFDVQRLTMQNLGLGVPKTCWHTARDIMAEVASLITITSGTVEKIAQEVYRLQSTEYGELEEPHHAGKVGSSTMPHKRNPSVCEAAISVAKASRAEASMVYEAMAQEHERMASLWRIEWIGLPSAFILLSSGLNKIRRVLAGLKLNRKRMRANLELTRGAILSEAVMLALGRTVGREKAHHIVYEASMKAFEEERSLKECLVETKELMDHLSTDDIEKMFDYEQYVGLAPEIARAAAADWQNKKQ